jgi:tripartite-type tricarboxylate transporter receptor subunit TctC
MTEITRKAISLLSRRALCAGLLALPTLAATRGVFAQSFPAHPLRLIVPYAAGGGTDAWWRR